MNLLEAISPTLRELASDAPASPQYCSIHTASRLVPINEACSGLKCPICVYQSIEKYLCEHPAWQFLRRETGGWVEICTACGHEKFVPCTRALSIRQPWAWLIVNGYKDVENRSRHIGNHLGPVLIHASAIMTKVEYFDCLQFVAKFDLLLMLHIPDYDILRKDCGGIVGKAFIRANGNTPHTSPWYNPKAGRWYLLEQSKPLPFQPCKGALGFFTPKL